MRKELRAWGGAVLLLLAALALLFVLSRSVPEVEPRATRQAVEVVETTPAAPEERPAPPPPPPPPPAETPLPAPGTHTEPGSVHQPEVDVRARLAYPLQDGTPAPIPRPCPLGRGFTHPRGHFPPWVFTTTFLNMNGLSLTLSGLPLAIFTSFRTTSRVLTYGYSST